MVLIAPALNYFKKKFQKILTKLPKVEKLNPRIAQSCVIVLKKFNRQT